MTTQPSKAELIKNLEGSVAEMLAYFEGPGKANPGRIDRWGAWEVLAHLPYWHYATTWGINSSAAGGPPWILSGSADQINDACLMIHKSESFETLVAQLRIAQERLLRAAQNATNLNAPAFARADGTTISVAERLATIARHWAGHLAALKEAAG